MARANMARPLYTKLSSTAQLDGYTEEQAEQLFKSWLAGDYSTRPGGSARGRIAHAFRLAIRKANESATCHRCSNELKATVAAMAEFDRGMNKGVPFGTIAFTAISKLTSHMSFDNSSGSPMRDFEAEFWTVLGYDDIPEQSLAV